MRKEEKESTDSVPESRHGQGLLVAHARALKRNSLAKRKQAKHFPHLDDFSDGVEHLAGNANGGEEVCLASRVDQLLA